MQCHLLLKDGPLVKGVVMPDEFYGCTVVKARMGSNEIVVLAPVFNEDAGLAARVNGALSLTPPPKVRAVRRIAGTKVSY